MIVDNHKFLKETIDKWKAEKNPMYYSICWTAVLMVVNIFLLPWVVSYAGTKICLDMGLPININYACAFILMMLIRAFGQISVSKPEEELDENDLVLFVYNSNSKLKSRIAVMLLTALLAAILL